MSLVAILFVLVIDPVEDWLWLLLLDGLTLLFCRVPLILVLAPVLAVLRVFDTALRTVLLLLLLLPLLLVLSLPLVCACLLLLLDWKPVPEDSTTCLKLMPILAALTAVLVALNAPVVDVESDPRSSSESGDRDPGCLVFMLV